MSSWIKAQEKMPSDRIAVLVWCPQRKNKYTAYWVSPKWFHFGGGYGVTEVQEVVSHWMPTPEAPRELTKREKIIVSIISTIQKVGKLPEWGEDLHPFAKTLTEEILFDLGEAE